jgi:Tfp pilus assembly protein PilN
VRPYHVLVALDRINIMSYSSQVIFQAAIYLQVISQAIIYLATVYTNNAADNATTALLEAQQAMSLLETLLTEVKASSIEKQNLLTVEVAYVDLELFIEKLQIALDMLSFDRAECKTN